MLRRGTGTSGQWVRLAAAVVKSGIDTGDTSFLRGRWCEYLTDVVVDWCREHDGEGTAVRLSKGAWHGDE